MKILYETIMILNFLKHQHLVLSHSILIKVAWDGQLRWLQQHWS